MRFSEISPPLSEYPQRGVFVAAPACKLCQYGMEAFKMKRQWVHHDSTSGRIIVCTAHDLKPRS